MRAGLSVLFLPMLAGFGLLGCSPDEPRSVPAKDIFPRLVTLSPHLAELVYAAGAGDNLIGVSAYSNYPDDVLALPQIGDAFSIDQEQLALLRPDVLLAWQSGTPTHTVDELRKLGYRVEVIRTQGLADVAAALRAIGRITDREDVANAAAVRYLAELDRLRQANAARAPIRVFYQVAERPIYTVNASHYVSELIELCGGQNVFSDLDKLAPAVSEESVLARNPELLLAGRVDTDERPLTEWTRWPELAASRYDNRFYVHSDLLARASPRLVRTGAAICRWLDEGRQNRSAVEAP